MESIKKAQKTGYKPAQLITRYLQSRPTKTTYFWSTSYLVQGYSSNREGLTAN